MKNAPDRIKDTFQSISRQRNISLTSEKFPFLENIPEYEEMETVRLELLEKIRKFQSVAGKVIDVIKEWHHDDPVRHLYANLFTGAQFRGINDFEEIAFKKNLDFRYCHKIPPGYKDAAKSDEGVGDLLVWNTILQEGAEKKCDVIFVCGEEKSDWWVRSEKQALVVRNELVEEYRRMSGGKTFRLISMADFLELFGASQEIVEEVKEGQGSVAAQLDSAQNDNAISRIEAENAAEEWILSHYGRVSQSPHNFDCQIVDPHGWIHLFEVRTSASRINSAKRISSSLANAEHAIEAGAKIRLVSVVLVSRTEQGALDEVEMWSRRASSLPRWFEIVIGFVVDKSRLIDIATIVGKGNGPAD